MRPSLGALFARLPHARTDVGVCVIDLATGATLFELHADNPLIPASTMKIYVMGAALEILGPDFVFETRLAVDRDNLFVIGDGDPSFGDERLQRRREQPIDADFSRWARTLHKHGRTSFAGDLVIDESVFDNQWFHPSWEQKDLDNWYAAPVGGLNYNDNCIDITIDPGGAIGSPVRVRIHPPSQLVFITNGCRTGKGTEPLCHHPYDTFEYRIKGYCTKRWRFAPVSFPDPGLLFADSMKTALQGEGITFAGKIQRRRIRQLDGTLPQGVSIIDRKTTLLVDVLSRAGKNSQNLFAECLFKRIGYQRAMQSGRYDRPGSWMFGTQAVLDMVDRAGINTRGLVVSDGSGLSRDNRSTARQMAEFLTHLEAQPYGELFRQNLSIAGIDGSLKTRLQGSAGLIAAKTGTMRGVSGLAGYAGPADHPRYAFAFLFNNYVGPSTPYKEIQDRACRILVSVPDPNR